MQRAKAKRGLAVGARVLLRALVTVGWGCVGLIALAIGLEVSGLPERWIARALSEQLGPAPGRVHIDDVDLLWTRRSALLRGLTLGNEQPDLRIEHLEVRLGWRPGRGVVIERAEVQGADLRVSRALVTGLESLLETREDEAPPELPELVVRGLSIAVETPEYGDLEVGDLDLAVLRDENGEPRLTGRLVPALGPSASGEIFLEGSQRGEDVLEVRGAARALPLTTGFLPDDATFDPLRELAPKIQFDLEAVATWQLGKDVLPTGRANLALVGGSMALPWLETPESRRVQDIEVALEIAFDPTQPLALWDRDAWHAVGQAQATWEGIELVAAARVGRAATEGRLAEAWCHAPALPLDERSLELGARREWLTDLWEALTPEGVIEVCYGFAVPRGWTPEEGVRDTTDRVAAILMAGDARTAYVGWPGHESGLRDQGFPLPLSDLRGSVFYAHHARRHLAEEVSIFDLVGRSGEDEVSVRCGVRFTPEWRRRPEQLEAGPERFHLLVESDRITVGDHLRPAFDGLRGIGGCEDLWTTYLPGGGGLGVRLELLRTADSLEEEALGMAADLRIGFQDVALRWVELPLGCEHVNGTLHLRTEGHAPDGRGVTSLDLVGRAEAVRGDVHVLGRSEHGSLGPDATRWEVRLDELDLNGSRLHEVVGLREPRALEGLETAGASGTADVTVTVTRAHEGMPQEHWLEATPTRAGLRLRPAPFPLETVGAQGRMLAIWGDAPTADVRFGLLGRWSATLDETPVWIDGRFPVEGGGWISALGAGVDPLAPALVSALESALSRTADEPVELDVSTVDGRGRIDFGAHLTLAPRTGEVETGDLSLQLRLEHLTFEGGDALRDLRGAVTWSPERGVWSGARLTAELGRTPVILTDATLTQPPEGGWTIEASLVAEGVPIDREHLRFFLDERTVRTLLEEFDVRGRFDVHGGTLALSVDAEGETSLRFNGQLSVRDLFARIGVPIKVNFAHDVHLDLRLEAGRVRALARVGALSGEVAGRLLDDARLQLTYIGPRLTIEALDGAFGGGRLRSLSGRGGSTFFAVDLEPPFPFVLAGRMVQVEVEEFLRGLFNSSFANRGRIEATLQLRGDLQHLTGIRGGGSFELLDSALWAVPLFQAVLSTLGFPTAATFSRMDGQYRVADGVIAFPELRLQSDLLSLVGAGTIDFDGTLVHDLEVRYALLEQTGPFRRLLYEIQNSLLRISVRGDMSRPEVIVRGLFSQFFSAPSEQRRLPLPGFVELPTRF